MGAPSASPDRPTPLMRLVLALVTAATTLFTAGPAILILGALITLGLLAGAAFALAHTGALEPATFASAHAYGLVGLIVFFTAALGYRVARGDAKGLLGLVSRRPVITAAVALLVLSLSLVRAEWDRGGLPALVGALVIDDLYFFSLGSVALMGLIAVLSARALYRWAARERYRAGLMTALQPAGLALLFALARTQPAPALPSDRPAPAAWQDDLSFAAQATSRIEAERRLLVAIDGLLEPGRRLPSAVEGATSAAGADDIRACIEELVTDVVQVQRSVGTKFRLSEGDAHDIVRDALLNVCSAHARKGYTRLGAVLQIAAERRALTWARRRARRCEIDVEWPSCSPTIDELVRFQQEDAILDRAFCQEEQGTQQIIRLRIEEELGFAEIDKRLGLRADEARYRFNNALRRMRKRLAERCDL